VSHPPEFLPARKTTTLRSPRPQWLRREDSHLHSRVQSPLSCSLDDTAKNDMARNIRVQVVLAERRWLISGWLRAS
jgi:hypothetical protein